MRSVTLFSFIILFFTLSLTSKAQEHHTDKIVMGAGYMGPNALTPPKISEAFIDSLSTISLGFFHHYHSEDPTTNLKVDFQLNLLAQVISIDGSYIPIEYFNTSDRIKKERNLTWYYDREKAQGDFYINTNIKVFSSQRDDIVARVGLKTAPSGFRDVGAARFTDTPGYYFDLAFGHSYTHNNKSKSRLFLDLGLYCYQTNDREHFQNDALLFAFGHTHSQKNLTISNAVTGYLGYLGIKDQPIVYRGKIQGRSQFFTYGIEAQVGIHHYNYYSLGLRMGFILDNGKRKGLLGSLLREEIEAPKYTHNVF